jgi:membrane protease YdiL (CAAX protease family)
MPVLDQLRPIAHFLLEAGSAVQTLSFFTVWVLIWMPIALPLAIRLRWHPPQPLSIQQKLPLVLTLYILAPPLLWGISRLEGVPFTAYGVGANPRFLVSLAIGLSLGVVGIAALFGLETLLGWLRWQPFKWQQFGSVALSTLVIGLLVSLVEEWVFRGLLVNLWQREYGWVVAAIVTSLIFAVLHLVWEGGEAAPQLPGLWLMGMVLVLARWVDAGSLGIACGLHAGWIWAMASLDTIQAIEYTEHSPAWMTGLAGKPLAGGMSLLLLLGTAAVLGGWSAVG